MRNTKTEYVSCPSCGRTLFDLQARRVVCGLAAGTPAPARPNTQHILNPASLFCVGLDLHAHQPAFILSRLSACRKGTSPKREAGSRGQGAGGLAGTRGQ